MVIVYPEEFALKLEAKSIEAEERRKERVEKAEIKARERLGVSQVKSSERLGREQISARKKIYLKQFGTKKARYKQILQPIQPAPLLSKEQDMMQDLFGGRGENRVMFQNPNSQCITQLNGALMSNHLGDEPDEETADCFGMGINRSTGGFFGF